MTADEDLVRRVWARWNEGEHTVDPALADPEIEVHSQLTRTVYRGYEGLLTWFGEIDQQFDNWQVPLEEVRAVGEGRVFARREVRGTGRQSGIDLEAPAAWIIVVRDGRILRIHTYLGRDEVARVAEESA